MPTIRLTFPAGRYHATPPGSHVNEGHVEWPPSPWRLLRALIACGFSTQQWSEVPEIAKSLIEKLASQPPRYCLPRVSMAHSRHYMPIGGIDGNGREKTTLVFDTWADVANQEVMVFWNCELTDDEDNLLAQLVDCLGYLGRSESWVEAKLVEADESQANAFPFKETDAPGPGWEQIHVLGPISPAEYLTWYQRKTEALLSELPPLDDKLKPTSKAYKDIVKLRAKALEPYPQDLIDCLTRDTSWWKSQRWSSPPGSRPILYCRPARQMDVSPPSMARGNRGTPVTSVLLAMTTRSGNRASLPSVARTLPQAELLHRQLVGAVTKHGNANCMELTGCDDAGRPLRLKHQHSHILPLDLDDDGHLDHILIHAPMRLGSEALGAIRSVRRTFAKKVADDLQLAVAGVGSISQVLIDERARLLSTTASVWKSVTPFVPPRFVKRSGKNSLEGQIQAELESRGLPPVDAIDILKSESVSFRHFVRVRKHGVNPPQPPMDYGFALTLRFSQPLDDGKLPLCLGYASHFGMGLFRSVG